MSILIDTGIFFGLYSKKDAHHVDSLILIIHVLEGKWGRPYITEHILDETLTLLKYKISSDAALKFLEAFVESKNVSIIQTDEEDIDDALDFFKKERKAKGLSFTDAVSITIVRKSNINFLMAYDKYLSKFVEVIDFNYVRSLPEKEIRRVMKLLPNNVK